MSEFRVWLLGAENQKKKQGEGGTDTSVFILTYGTTSALGSVVWRFVNKFTLLRRIG